MNDRQILELLHQRDEAALKALTEQHSAACIRLAKRILGDDSDAAEVWDDALLHIWNAIPPAEPDNLAAYLRTAVKRLALQRREAQQAKKRGGGETAVSLEAIPENLQPAHSSVEQLMEERMLDEAVNRFLSTLPKEARTIFVHHYGNGRSIREIAEAFDITQSKVAVTLMRIRIKLRKYLNGEGWL